MTKKNSQNWRNVNVLVFKTMAIIANCSFFIPMNTKKLKLKIHLIKFSISIENFFK